ncbi:outer membrane lipoprotein-sorting protein [Candidatus Nitrotoga sp. M5]|uniref:outer membrane lipoprotein-sorting protein n=1 Tax=Candidatus Nitrotoga sp. M5 TaxID=2890409 RepID=UPI001EF26C94|nr:outer membrane lipoprotein-sorting protein [Candidatus Nitrotoga sp. M5]CAH1385948.1 conserved exported hypothetical protein [Candidatus Nitrotoga sp. M5]
MSILYPYLQFMTLLNVHIKRHQLKAFWRTFLITMLLSICTTTVAADKTSNNNFAREILSQADRIRFPDEGFQVDVTITTTEPGTDEDVRVYRILSKGNNQTLVQTTAPAVDRGQILLMRDRDLWAFLPNLSQPIRLPLSQKLTGQVANGDLARANFVGDYEPKLLRTENIDGVSYRVLQLDAVDRGVTYSKVLFWINEKNNRPYKAEFYALSGRLLKTGHYQAYRALGGDLRPTQLIIEDSLRHGRRSALEYRDMVIRDLPDKIFSKDYLKKLSR